MLTGKKLNWLVTACVVTIILAVYVVWLSFNTPATTQNEGGLTLIDGQRVSVSGDSYRLDLDTFDEVGETQECVFVFRNDNADTSHTTVSITWNEDCFDVDYDPSFSIKPGQEFSYRISIELTDLPADGEGLDFALQFNTQYYD